MLDDAQLRVWTLPSWVSVGGAIVLYGSIAGVLLAQSQMGDNWSPFLEQGASRLDKEGVFVYVRRPIYMFLCTMMSGIVFLIPTPYSVGLPVMGVVLYALQARNEERHLLEHHGVAYERYMETAGFFWPKLIRK